MSGKRVLSVGQCMADHGSIGRLLRGHFATDVVPASTVQEALGKMRQETFALVLVNRVFDATNEGGLDFIRQVKAEPPLQTMPIMLVSNFPEAQAEAEAAGAIPGFGKSALREQDTLDRLRPYLA